MTFVSHAQAAQRVPSVFNENVVLTPTGLISEEASGGAERGCRVVVTELLPPPPTAALTRTLARKAKRDSSVALQTCVPEWGRPEPKAAVTTCPF